MDIAKISKILKLKRNLKLCSMMNRSVHFEHKLWCTSIYHICTIREKQKIQRVSIKYCFYNYYDFYGHDSKIGFGCVS